jgi:hypothetical protein
MAALRPLLLAALALAFCLSASARAPAPLPRRERDGLPVGRWTVRFDNGVVQTCEVRGNGTIHVVEPHRNSGGKAVLAGRSVVITCDDDRAERWTRSQGRMVVEHWFPASAYPAGRAVRGVAERAR